MQKLKKIRTGPVQKKLFRPAGIPAGKESSTGPDRTGPDRTGRLPVPVTALQERYKYVFFVTVTYPFLAG